MLWHNNYGNVTLERGMTMAEIQHPAQVTPEMRARIMQEGTPEARAALEKTDEVLMVAQEEGTAPTPPRKPGQN